MSSRGSVARSAGAILAGFAAIVVLSIGADEALRAAGIFPKLGQPMSDGLFVLATVYRTLFGVAGGYITAWTAPNRPMPHALWLGGIGLILNFVGLIVSWSAGLEFGPKWYPIALVLTAMPSVWAGAKLR